jgi:hypothetical protein
MKQVLKLVVVMSSLDGTCYTVDRFTYAYVN